MLLSRLHWCYLIWWVECNLSSSCCWLKLSSRLWKRIKNDIDTIHSLRKYDSITHLFFFNRENSTIKHLEHIRSLRKCRESLIHLCYLVSIERIHSQSKRHVSFIWFRSSCIRQRYDRRECKRHNESANDRTCSEFKNWIAMFLDVILDFVNKIIQTFNRNFHITIFSSQRCWRCERHKSILTIMSSKLSRFFHIFSIFRKFAFFISCIFRAALARCSECDSASSALILLACASYMHACNRLFIF